jgi:hypothetical protein
MWKPKESLDDFLVKPPTEAAVKPPRKVWLRLTSEKRKLQPLTREEEPRVKSYRPNAPFQPLWFRRLVAVGSGALAVIAFALISAILIGISDPSAGTEVATNLEPAGAVMPSEEPFSLYDLSASSLAPAGPKIDIVSSHVRRKPARARIRFAGHKPKPELRSLPQPEEPTFAPTTLVIYAENGVINTRIEPWLQAGYKKLPTFHN